MIKYLLRFIWALIFQIIWTLFTLISTLIMFLFDLDTLKKEIKISKGEFWKYFITYWDITENEWYLFGEKGEWKSIFNCSFKIKKN